MNKTLRIIFIILLSMLAVGIGIVFVKLLTGNGFLNFSFNRFESKELVIEEVYDNIFENININSEEGNIYIEQSNDDKIKVVVYGKKEISEVKVENDTLVIKGDTDKCSFICFNHKIARIEVYIPSNFDKNIKIEGDTSDTIMNDFEYASIEITDKTGDVTIGKIKDVNIKTSTGDIRINNAEKAKIKTTTGDIRLREVNDAELNTTTGDINITTVNNADLSTTTGDIDIDKVNNSIHASTTTGDITINELELTENSKIDATTGDITIRNTNEIYIDASSSTGDIHINNNYRTAEFELRIKTSTGDIKVKN